MPDDAALTEVALAAQRGDRAAAEEFARLTYQPVWRLLVALTDRRVAEDLAQETFARVFRSLPGFRAESSVRAWVLSIARRVAVDHVRHAVTRPRIDHAAILDEHTAAPDDVSESVALSHLLDGLDPDRKVAFVLTQVLGLGYAEAAQVCGCPVGTIRSRVARARGDLVASMAERGAEHGSADAAGLAGPLSGGNQTAT